METSTVQAIKLAIVASTGLSKDALHIYVGLGVVLLTSLCVRQGLRSLVPLLSVALIACLGEVLDMRDDLRSLGHWRWGASLHDVLNTTFWPLVLCGLARWTALFGDHQRA